MGISAPCPSWWLDSAPTWDPSVLRVIAPTPTRLVALAVGEGGPSILQTLKARCEALHEPKTFEGRQIEKATEQGAEEKKHEVPLQEKTARDIDTAENGAEGKTGEIAGHMDDAKSLAGNMDDAKSHGEELE